VSQLTRTPFNLRPGQPIIVRGRARNALGWGPYSKQEKVAHVNEKRPGSLPAPKVAGSTIDCVTLEWGTTSENPALFKQGQISQKELDAMFTKGRNLRSTDSGVKYQIW